MERPSLNEARGLVTQFIINASFDQMKNIVLSGCLKVSPECRPVQLTVPFNLSQQRLFQSIWDPRYLKFLELLMVEFILPEELVDGRIQC